MQPQIFICSLLALAGATLALPTPTTNTNNDAPHHLATRTLSPIQVLTAIMPSSTSCSGRGDQCVTGEVALTHLQSGMDNYGVTSKMEQAGILALVAYESEELMYKINTVEANAASGQGTSNMQHGNFNLEFANTFPELESLGLTESTVLDHVTANKYNFWTGPWYYTTKCTAAKSMADNGSNALEWFKEYMAKCVQVDISAQPDRLGYFDAALNALGLSESSTQQSG